MDTFAQIFSKIQIKKVIYPILLGLLALVIAVTFALVISSLTYRLNAALTIETKTHDISFSMTNYTTVAKKLNIIPDASNTSATAAPSSTPTVSTSSSVTASSTTPPTQKVLKK